MTSASRGASRSLLEYKHHFPTLINEKQIDYGGGDGVHRGNDSGPVASMEMPGVLSRKRWGARGLWWLEERRRLWILEASSSRSHAPQHARETDKRMTSNEFKRRYPNASPTTIRLNSTDGDSSQDHPPRVRPVNPKPDGRLSLHGQGSGEEARWYGSARRFEITFIVYSQHPCDYDGYDIKALQDWCVRIGLIPDDGWKTLFGRTRSEKVQSEAEERTEIEIRPC